MDGVDVLAAALGDLTLGEGRPHRPHPPADPVAGLEHADVEALRPQLVGGDESREAGPDHDHAAPSGAAAAAHLRQRQGEARGGGGADEGAAGEARLGQGADSILFRTRKSG